MQPLNFVQGFYIHIQINNGFSRLQRNALTLYPQACLTICINLWCSTFHDLVYIFIFILYSCKERRLLCLGSDLHQNSHFRHSYFHKPSYSSLSKLTHKRNSVSKSNKIIKVSITPFRLSRKCLTAFLPRANFSVSITGMKKNRTSWFQKMSKLHVLKRLLRQTMTGRFQYFIMGS